MILREREERSVELPTPCLEMTGTEAKLGMSSRNSQIGAECVILTKILHNFFSSWETYLAIHDTGECGNQRRTKERYDEIWRWLMVNGDGEVTI